MATRVDSQPHAVKRGARKLLITPAVQVNNGSVIHTGGCHACPARHTSQAVAIGGQGNLTLSQHSPSTPTCSMATIHTRPAASACLHAAAAAAAAAVAVLSCMPCLPSGVNCSGLQLTCGLTCWQRPRRWVRTQHTSRVTHAAADALKMQLPVPAPLGRACIPNPKNLRCRVKATGPTAHLP